MSYLVVNVDTRTLVGARDSQEAADALIAEIQRYQGSTGKQLSRYIVVQPGTPLSVSSH